jgi:hypothetical protein
MPRLVRLSFILFVLALAVTGSQMASRVPNILPWAISAEVGVLYGWMFVGSASYFAYGLLRPSWHNSVGQLAGFLAYDLILIVPFAARLSSVSPQLRINLIVYIIVLGYSGLLAIYYLLVNRETRIFGRGQTVPQIQGVG